nr:MFS transporter [Actinoplanes derwentensis]
MASDIGTSLSTVAFAFGILDLQGSAADLGWVMAARVAPLLIVTLIGGVWIDRLPRERVLVGTQIASAISQAVTAVLLLTGTAQIWQLMGLSFVAGAATSLWVPASGAVMPTLVPGRLLNEANALSRLASNTIMILGAGLGGLLASVIDPGWVVLADALTFVVSAFFLARLPATRAHIVEGATSFWRQLRDGWKEFAAQDWLWPVVIQFAFVNIAWTGAYTLIGPLFAREQLGGAAPWGAILAANAVGTVLGGVVALRYKPVRPMVVGVLCVTALAGPLLAIALGGSVWVIGACSLVAGFFMEIFEVQYAVSMQSHVPQDKMARVSAYDGLVSFGVLPLGYALAGPLVVLLGTGSAAGAAGLLIVVVSLLTLLAPGVRRLRAVPQEEARAAQDDKDQTDPVSAS